MTLCLIQSACRHYNISIDDFRKGRKRSHADARRVVMLLLLRSRLCSSYAQIGIVLNISKQRAYSGVKAIETLEQYDKGTQAAIAALAELRFLQMS